MEMKELLCCFGRRFSFFFAFFFFLCILTINLHYYNCRKSCSCKPLLLWEAEEESGLGQGSVLAWPGVP